MPNRLAGSTSPYLRQHAANPVDWYEWGEEAFGAARARDVPILLSVGYSACHWCHVMAHESFEDPVVAAEMNQRFVNVKVDREERPDVDAVYMDAVQATTGQGGWPMTVWLTPEGQPFYAGTYFPAHDHPGRPSFLRVMQAVTEAWQERRHLVLQQAGRLTESIGRVLPVADDLPGPDSLAAAYRAIAAQYDRTNGGLGGPPKFPQQPVLEYLLRVVDEPWAPDARRMVGHTLEKMARGGIYDHLGGGFARYSVDSQWLVPHFEKMLYDNAQLARIYLWGWIELGDERFRRVAEETLEYLRRDLRHPDGGFYSAEDADSEGSEGAFYVWTRDDFLEAAGPDDGPIAASRLGVTPEGNFEGSNVLHESRTVEETAREHRLSLPETEAAISRAKRSLLDQRRRRIRPGLDDKVIASWNGLAIRAYAEAGAVLGRPDLIDEARKAARFVLERLRRDDERLARSWARERIGGPGFLEDHAAMATGLFALYAVTGEIDWYREAIGLATLIPALFSDPAGGFFTTGNDAETLVTRPKDQMDNPLPSGNSLAAESLLLASPYTGDSALREAADGAIRAGGLMIERYPTAAGHLLSVLHTIHRGPRELAVVGPSAGELVQVAWTRFRPHLAIAIDTDGMSGADVPLLSGRWDGNRTLAHVCSGFVCDRPTDDPEALAASLG